MKQINHVSKCINSINSWNIVDLLRKLTKEISPQLLIIVYSPLRNFFPSFRTHLKAFTNLQKANSTNWATPSFPNQLQAVEVARPPQLIHETAPLHQQGRRKDKVVPVQPQKKPTPKLRPPSGGWPSWNRGAATPLLGVSEIWRKRLYFSPNVKIASIPQNSARNVAEVTTDTVVRITGLVVLILMPIIPAEGPKIHAAAIFHPHPMLRRQLRELHVKRPLLRQRQNGTKPAPPESTPFRRPDKPNCQGRRTT